MEVHSHDGVYSWSTETYGVGGFESREECEKHYLKVKDLMYNKEHEKHSDC